MLGNFGEGTRKRGFAGGWMLSGSRVILSLGTVLILTPEAGAQRRAEAVAGRKVALTHKSQHGGMFGHLVV